MTGRFPRDVSEDNVGTSGCHSCAGRTPAYTQSSWAGPCCREDGCLLCPKDSSLLQAGCVGAPASCDALKNKSFVLGKAQTAAMSKCSPQQLPPTWAVQWLFTIEFPGSAPAPERCSPRHGYSKQDQSYMEWGLLNSGHGHIANMNKVKIRLR